MSETRILMGVVGRPHGVRGLVHVQSFTADPADLTAYGPLEDEQGRAWTLAWRGAGIAALCDAAGRQVADREAAAGLTNLRLYLDRGRLPEAEAESFYHADLIGLVARDAGGAVLGRVAAVHDYGGGASLEITRAGAGPLLVPFTRRAVPEVAVARGFVVVVPPAEIDGEERAA